MLANHVLISIFKLGSKVSKIVTTENIGRVSVVTSLCFFGGCYPIELSLPKRSRPKHVIIVLVVDKREHIILIFGGNKQKFSTVMQFFLCVLVCELKFCNVMWSLPKHYCHNQKMCSHYQNMGCFVKIKDTELSTGSMYIQTNESLTFEIMINFWPL